MVKSSEDYYTVEKILEKKKVGKKTLYRVKWEGYSENECTWEPMANLKNVKDIVREFERLEGLTNLLAANTQNSTNLNDGFKKKLILPGSSGSGAKKIGQKKFVCPIKKGEKDDFFAEIIEE